MGTHSHLNNYIYQIGDLVQGCYNMKVLKLYLDATLKAPNAKIRSNQYLNPQEIAPPMWMWKCTPKWKH